MGLRGGLSNVQCSTLNQFLTDKTVEHWPTARGSLETKIFIDYFNRATGGLRSLATATLDIAILSVQTIPSEHLTPMFEQLKTNSLIARKL